MMGHERAVANARAGCTELSRRRLEREKVELWMERRLARIRRTG